MKKWKTLALQLFLGSLMSPVVADEAQDNAADSLTKFNLEMVDVYKKQGGYQLTLSLRDGNSYVEFCPDNTCDEFKMPVTSSLGSAYDFIYLFEFSVPSYDELEKKWKVRNDVTRYVAQLMRRYRVPAKCNSKKSGQEQRICVMRYLIASEHIEISLVRNDEGKRVVSPTVLEEFRGK